MKWSYCILLVHVLLQLPRMLKNVLTKLNIAWLLWLYLNWSANMPDCMFSTQRLAMWKTAAPMDVILAVILRSTYVYIYMYYKPTITNETKQYKYIFCAPSSRLPICLSVSYSYLKPTWEHACMHAPSSCLSVCLPRQSDSKKRVSVSSSVRLRIL